MKRFYLQGPPSKYKLSRSLLGCALLEYNLLEREEPSGRPLLVSYAWFEAIQDMVGGSRNAKSNL